MSYISQIVVTFTQESIYTNIHSDIRQTQRDKHTLDTDKTTCTLNNIHSYHTCYISMKNDCNVSKNTYVIEIERDKYTHKTVHVGMNKISFFLEMMNRCV